MVYSSRTFLSPTDPLAQQRGGGSINTTGQAPSPYLPGGGILRGADQTLNNMTYATPQNAMSAYNSSITGTQNWLQNALGNGVQRGYGAGLPQFSGQRFDYNGNPIGTPQASDNNIPLPTLPTQSQGVGNAPMYGNASSFGASLSSGTGTVTKNYDPSNYTAQQVPSNGAVTATQASPTTTNPSTFTPYNVQGPSGWDQAAQFSSPDYTKSLNQNYVGSQYNQAGLNFDPNAWGKTYDQYMGPGNFSAQNEQTYQQQISNALGRGGDINPQRTDYSNTLDVLNSQLKNEQALQAQGQDVSAPMANIQAQIAALTGQRPGALMATPVAQALGLPQAASQVSQPTSPVPQGGPVAPQVPQAPQAPQQGGGFNAQQLAQFLQSFAPGAANSRYSSWGMPGQNPFGFMVGQNNYGNLGGMWNGYGSPVSFGNYNPLFGGGGSMSGLGSLLSLLGL